MLDIFPTFFPRRIARGVPCVAANLAIFPKVRRNQPVYTVCDFRVVIITETDDNESR